PPAGRLTAHVLCVGGPYLTLGLLYFQYAVETQAKKSEQQLSAAARRPFFPEITPLPFCGCFRAANQPVRRLHRSPDGLSPSAWRSAAPACPRARYRARRC